MSARLFALPVGALAGFVVSWARFTDPSVIRDMLLLREAHVFLVMGSAVLVATVGCRLLRAAGFRALGNGETVSWRTEAPSRRHVAGSALFGAGWALAGTCPGPLAAMLGEGRLGGIAVAVGLLGGVALQGAWARVRERREESVVNREATGIAGL